MHLIISPTFMIKFPFSSRPRRASLKTFEGNVLRNKKKAEFRLILKALNQWIIKGNILLLLSIALVGMWSFYVYNFLITCSREISSAGIWHRTDSFTEVNSEICKGQANPYHNVHKMKEKDGSTDNKISMCKMASNEFVMKMWY